MMVGLVCRHVSRRGAPALLVARQAPEDPDDSGFLVACGAEGHGDMDWLVADLECRVRALGLNELAEGQQATRTAPGQPWQVSELPPDEEAA